MKRQVSKIVLMVFLAISANMLRASEPTTIRLTISGSLPGSPLLKYSKLFVGPATELSWPEESESLVFTLESPQVVEFFLGDESVLLYLRPGDELAMDLDEAESLDALGFGNSTADVNNSVFIDYQRKFKEELEPTAVSERVSAQPQIDLYEFEIFDQAGALRDYIGQHPQIDAVSPDFKEYLSLEPRYFYWSRLFAHPVYQSDAGILNIKSIPRVMYENFDPTILAQGNLISEEYRQLLRFYLVFATAESSDFKKFEVLGFLQEYYSVCETLIDGEALAFAMSNILIKNGDNLPPSGIRSFYNRLQGIPEASAYAALVAESLGERLNAKDEERNTKKSKARAKVKHDVEFFDEKGKAVGLEEFAGRVVYVDFWASWCGPCRRQFPYTKEMKTRFSEKELKEIVFLYISIDKSEEAWKSGVDKLGLEGEHLFSPGGWRSDACTYFGISSIPRYMILDKDGEIVYPNAPRPSSPETFDILRKLATE